MLLPKLTKLDIFPENVWTAYRSQTITQRIRKAKIETSEISYFSDNNRRFFEFCHEIALENQRLRRFLSTNPRQTEENKLKLQAHFLLIERPCLSALDVLFDK